VSEALRLEDVLARTGLAQFQARWGRIHARHAEGGQLHPVRHGRLAGQLPELDTTALLLVDEIGALGTEARHLRGLVGRARESGLAVVLATQGPSDPEAVDR
jgi:hypothetical protein